MNGVKLEREQNNQIVGACDMEDGQIGEIIWCEENKQYTGMIVHAYGSDLIPIGGRYGRGWTNRMNLSMIKVRILQPGEKIVIQ